MRPARIGFEKAKRCISTEHVVSVSITPRPPSGAAASPLGQASTTSPLRGITSLSQHIPEQGQLQSSSFVVGFTVVSDDDSL